MGAFEHMTHPAFFVRAQARNGGGKDHENQVKSPESSKNAKRAKPVRPQKKPLSIEELHRQMMAPASSPAFPTRPGHRRRRSGRSARPHRGRAAVGNHHPRAALRWHRRTSSIPAPWSNATSRRPAPPGFAASRRRSPSTVIYIARITAVEVTCAVAHRRKGKTLTSPCTSSIPAAFANTSPGVMLLPR